MSTTNSYTVFFCGVILALLFGVWVGHEWEQESIPGHAEQRVAVYLNGQLTNPLLECAEAEEGVTIGERAVIEKSVTEYAERAKSQGMVSEYAIYFRDLNNGPWFGINERLEFTPGSLLKLPLAMSYYKAQQQNPQLLTMQIEFDAPVPTGATESNFGSDAPLQPGTYSVRDLVSYMLKESSNDAAEVLAGAAGEQQIFSTYHDLGIEPPSFGSDYSIDTKTFGAFFRVLYNASYVGQPASEELLTILTQVTYRDGLVAGVPEGVKVAHKFGTRVVDGPGGRQLHDCGIVYAPGTPYILCVMSRGNSSQNLSHFIAQVSELVYGGVVK